MSEFIHGHRLSKEKRLTVATPGKHFFLGCMWCWVVSRAGDPPSTADAI